MMKTRSTKDYGFKSFLKKSDLNLYLNVLGKNSARVNKMTLLFELYLPPFL